MHSMYDTITRQETRLLSKFASSQYSSPEGSSGHCVLRITKFDEKISLALREKKKRIKRPDKTFIRDEISSSSGKYTYLLDFN